MTSVQHARRSIMSISNSIAYMYKDCNVGYILDDRFESNPSSGPRVFTLFVGPVERPDHLDDDFLRIAKAKFYQFVESVRTTINSNKDRWNIKAKEVEDLETFVRGKMAVNKESFHFLEKGMLTKHKIWWKKRHAESFEKIPWVKLL